MLPDHDRITVQHVPASIYKASYACRWLNRRRIAGLLESAGYVLSPWYDSAVDPKGFVGVTAIPQTARAADSPKLTEIPRPLRVMQVDDFYPGYLDAFYRARPGLTLKSSREQIDALLKDGFSAVHAVVPCLPKNECETEYFVHQALPLQRAWAREQNLTFPAENPDWQGEMIRRRVESFRPDVLYMADPVRFDGRFLATLPFRPRLVLGWKGADVPFNADFHGYDAILSGLPKLLRFAETRGRGARRHVPPRHAPLGLPTLWRTRRRPWMSVLSAVFPPLSIHGASPCLTPWPGPRRNTVFPSPCT